MESPEGFGMVVSFVAFPMFFLSGALFDVDGLPTWLSVLVLIDPITYAVDGLRGTLLGTSRFSIAIDLLILSAFALIMVIIGTQFFKRMKV
jgi:ABC-2 type transport system permease protein